MQGDIVEIIQLIPAFEHINMNMFKCRMFLQDAVIVMFRG